jgi:hypothetical protein
MLIIFFSFLQAANLVFSFLNNCCSLTEIILENEDSEKSCKGDPQPGEWNAFLFQNLVLLDFTFQDELFRLMDINPSKSFLNQPETPPPDFA